MTPQSPTGSASAISNRSDRQAEAWPPTSPQPLGRPILVTAGLLAGFLCFHLLAADYTAPAGNRSALRRPGAESVLPGGRFVASLGQQYTTGPGPFGLAISPGGNLVVSANGGPDRYSLTVLRK